MKVIFGLGNPGQKYTKTRHNAGFMFVDEFAEFLGWNRLEVRDWELRKGFEAEVREVYAGGLLKMLLVKPETFMNDTGRSAMQIVKKYNVDVERDFILVHDDLDIETGLFKIQVATAPKDHKGVKSVEMLLGDKNFLRIRLGVDSRRGDRSIPGDEYVLEKFSKEDEELIRTAIADASKQLRTLLAI